MAGANNVNESPIPNVRGARLKPYPTTLASRQQACPAGTSRRNHRDAKKKRRGETRIVLRYKDPRQKATKQCERLRADGSPWPFTVNDNRNEFAPIASREAAKTLARRLSNWVWKQHAIVTLRPMG